MHRFVVGAALAFASLVSAPRIARADIFSPPVPAGTNPNSVYWFYGCADVPAGACLTIGMGPMQLGGQQKYVGIYGGQLNLMTPFGIRYELFDAFSWRLPDGTCSGALDDLVFDANSCFVQNIQSERITARINYFIPPSQFPNIAAVTLTAIPEPASIVLVATGFLALVAVGTSQRRRSKFAA